MLAVLFGLSTDYEVFLLSRVREEWDRTGDNTEAVAAGLQRTGGIITAAALLLIIVVAGFATGGAATIKMLGVGTCRGGRGGRGAGPDPARAGDHAAARAGGTGGRRARWPGCTAGTACASPASRSPRAERVAVLPSAERWAGRWRGSGSPCGDRGGAPNGWGSDSVPATGRSAVGEECQR